MSLFTLLLHSQNELCSERRSLKGDGLVPFHSDTMADTELMLWSSKALCAPCQDDFHTALVLFFYNKSAASVCGPKINGATVWFH